MATEKITAPFTEAQIKELIAFQASAGHPFTCGGANCVRSERADDGILIPRREGWVCPCGKYTQNWAHAFMADEKVVKAQQLNKVRMRASLSSKITPDDYDEAVNGRIK